MTRNLKLIRKLFQLRAKWVFESLACFKYGRDDVGDDRPHSVHTVILAERRHNTSTYTEVSGIPLQLMADKSEIDFDIKLPSTSASHFTIQNQPICVWRSVSCLLLQMPSIFFPPYCFCSRRKVRRAVYSAMLPNLSYSRDKYCFFFFFLVVLTDIFFSLGSSFVVISGKQMLYSFIVRYKVSWFGSSWKHMASNRLQFKYIHKSFLALPLI